MLEWVRLTSEDQLREVKKESLDRPVLIYKHSSRCGLSNIALNRLEKDSSALSNMVKPYFLDLIQYRQISDGVADHYQIRHESPQVLIIQNGYCIYHSSHIAISADDIKSILRNRN